MQAAVVGAVRHTATAAAVVNSATGRPSRSAAVAARQLASAALSAQANGSQSPERVRQRSPSSSLSPLEATPPPAGDTTDGGVTDASTVENVTPVKRAGSPASTTGGEEEGTDGSAASAPAAEEKPPKKKRTRKVKEKEPVVYVIPEVERLETTFKYVLPGRMSIVGTGANLPFLRPGVDSVVRRTGMRSVTPRRILTRLP